MQKYKLINLQTKEEHLCDKVTIEGFDYYVSDKCSDLGGWHIDIEFKLLSNPSRHNVVDSMRKVVATNNPNIDIQKVVDEVEILAHTYFAEERFNWEEKNPNGLKSPQSLIEHYNKTFTPLYKAGYNKSQETHPNSDEDMIEFSNYLSSQMDEDGLILNPNYIHDKILFVTDKELLKIWKEQQPKIVYYNE